MVKVHKFKIGEKKYCAVFNLNVLDKLGEMAGPAEDGTPLDAHAILEIWSTRYGMIRALLVLLREGEAMEGRELDIDEDWLKSHLTPAEGMWLQRKLSAMLVEGMRMEETMDADEEVDMVLEELKKKVVTGASPSEPSEDGDSSPD